MSVSDIYRTRVIGLVFTAIVAALVWAWVSVAPRPTIPDDIEVCQGYAHSRKGVVITCGNNSPHLVGSITGTMQMRDGSIQGFTCKRFECVPNDNYK
jgi:hypothetical protein